MPRTLSGSRTAGVHTNNIIYNGTFEVAPSVLTAQTNTVGRWIDGTAAGSQAKSGFGWGTVTITSSSAVGFDNTVSNSGTNSLKLSTLNTTGAITAGSFRTNGPNAGSAFELFTLLPGTSYTLTGFIKTNNVATNGAFIDCREFSASFANLATTSTNKLSGTNNFTKVTATFTTNASTAFGGLFLRNNVTGNTSDAWFDDIVLFQTLFPARSAASGRTLVT